MAGEPNNPIDWTGRIPDGAIINGELAICQFLHPDTGGLQYQVWCSGDLPLSSFLGLLELGKIEMLQRTNIIPEVDNG